ncbi:MAG: hypothetical protein JXB00_03765 [Bacteroidales bacterium]|nr:hypothetical protein [Bacteroidales bacterium]
MNHSFKNTIIRIVAVLLILLTGVVIVNKSLNIHVHRDANGSVFVHAHPYDKSNDSGPTKSHHHSGNELFCIQQAEILYMAVFLLLISTIVFSVTNFFLHSPSFQNPFILHLQNGRAPPAI